MTDVTDVTASANEYRRELLAAMMADDMEFIRQRLPPNTSTDVVEMTYQKLRTGLDGLSPAKQAESRLWLAARGLHPLHMPRGLQ